MKIVFVGLPLSGLSFAKSLRRYQRISFHLT